MRGLNLPRHMRELHSDNRMVNKSLPKRLSLVCVFHAFVVADACEAGGLDCDSETLVVEVCHDNFETLVFFANEVFHGNLDVFEIDIGCARGPDSLAVHFASGDSGHGAFDEEDRDTTHAGLAGADGDSEVIGPDTVGDPFLCQVNVSILYPSIIYKMD